MLFRSAVLQARNLVEEIELALPTPTGDFRSIKRGVVMPADRKSVVSGKSVDLGGRRIIKKKKHIIESH